VNRHVILSIAKNPFRFARIVQALETGFFVWLAPSSE
jgi:hypothetical protein